MQFPLRGRALHFQFGWRVKGYDPRPVSGRDPISDDHIYRKQLTEWILGRSDLNREQKAAELRRLLPGASDREIDEILARIPVESP